MTNEDHETLLAALRMYFRIVTEVDRNATKAIATIHNQRRNPLHWRPTDMHDV